MTARRLRVTVFGRVQGVGYRYFCLSAAQEAGVRGWVRNRPDGAVELEAEGGEPALGRFLEALRKGPALARVESLDEMPLSPRNDPAEDFIIAG